MWEYVAAIGWPQSQQNAHDCWAASGSQENAIAAHYNLQAHAGFLTGMSQQPMGMFSPEPSAKDCEGCGAPAVRYSHHCEYCKRPR